MCYSCHETHFNVINTCIIEHLDAWIDYEADCKILPALYWLNRLEI